MRFIKKVGYFDIHFKNVFIEVTSDYYSKFVQQRKPISDLELYTKEIQEKLKEEVARCSMYLDDDLAQIVHFAMKGLFIDKIITELLNSNFEKLFLEEKHEQLRFYFEMMKGNETFELFVNFYRVFVKNRTELIISKKDQLVHHIFKFYMQMSSTIQEVYSEELALKSSLEKAFECSINRPDVHFAKHFSSYLSQRMEKTGQMVELEQEKKDLLSYLSLFKFVQNKKVFIQHFNQR